MEVMENLIEAHRQLLDLASLKKQALIDNDIDQLMAITNKEGRFVKQISDLERQRILAMGSYMVEQGLRPNPYMTVTDLTKLLYKADEKKALISLQVRLLDTIERFKKANTLNRQLLEQSLNFVNYSLDILVGPPDNDAIYHNPQKQTQSYNRPGIFDSRA
jgi:flagellar biosynthesis/type III secretory pathway chaperone